MNASNLHGNLRAALYWTCANEQSEMAVRLAGSLYPMWDLHGHYREGLAWLKRVLALDGGGVPGVIRARALMGVATLATIQNDLELGASACEEAAGLCTEAGDGAGLAHALQYLGLGATLAGELEVADDLLMQSLDHARQAEDDWLEAWAHIFQGGLALSREDHDGAIRCADLSSRPAQRAGDAECIAWGQLIAATGHLLKADTDHAIPGIRAGLIAFQRLGGLWGLSVAIFVCALRAANAQDWEHALSLFGASERLRVSIGATLMTFMADRLEAFRLKAHTELGGIAHQWWHEGEDLTLEDAVSRSLAELDTAR